MLTDFLMTDKIVKGLFLPFTLIKIIIYFIMKIRSTKRYIYETYYDFNIL